MKNIKSQGRLLNSEKAKTSFAVKRLHKESSCLKKQSFSEIWDYVFISWLKKKKKKADFKPPSLFCPRSVSVCKKQNRALFSLNLQEQRALHKKGVIYSLYPWLEQNDKGTFSLHSGNILASLPKYIMERWAPLPKSSYPATLALRTGGFVFSFT